MLTSVRVDARDDLLGTWSDSFCRSTDRDAILSAALPVEDRNCSTPAELCGQRLRERLDVAHRLADRAGIVGEKLVGAGQHVVGALGEALRALQQILEVRAVGDR